MLENQNRRIDDLLERIRLQQEKLDKQNVRIRTLQSQVGGWGGFTQLFNNTFNTLGFLAACGVFSSLMLRSGGFLLGAGVEKEQRRVRGAERLAGR